MQRFFMASLLACAMVAARGTGLISRYATRFSGRRTADGEIYNPKSRTAASRTLPFGTCVRLTDIRTKRSTTVKVNDRGPWVKNRLFDISSAAARDLRMVGVDHAYYRVVPCN